MGPLFRPEHLRLSPQRQKIQKFGDAMSDEVFQRLRAETARMLGFSDVTKLSGLESMQVGLAATLLLEIDNLQELAANGQSVDLNRVADAVKILKSLMPSAPLSAQQPDFTGARAELKTMLEQRAYAIERRDSHVADELQEIIDKQAAENEQLRTQLAALNATPGRPELPATPPPDPPRQKAQPPSSYLANRNEPWRPYVGPDGATPTRGGRWGPI
jgi:hypothetical protein